MTAKIGKNQGADIEIQAAQVDVVDNVSASAETAAGPADQRAGRAVRGDRCRLESERPADSV
ncbi:MAG TPA: hypothetical protein VMP01_07320 [Pirellulaceae bacterium]|nr:hypothetical protein [Pirellulaceae bacterium]